MTDCLRLALSVGVENQTCNPGCRSALLYHWHVMVHCGLTHSLPQEHAAVAAQELLEGLRPRMVRHETFEAASKAVADLEAAEAKRGDLGTIDEAEEEEEDQEDESDSNVGGSDEGSRGRNGQSIHQLLVQAEVAAVIRYMQADVIQRTMMPPHVI